MVQYTDLVSDTICAQITAPGHSGVSVVRVSGERAQEICRKITTNLPSSLISHKIYLTNIVDPDGSQLVDQALISYFAPGKSFTGDEVLEIACHGNPTIVHQIVALLLAGGCRIAERGEFSFRAFYNGKIDLVQAESIHSLVTSSSSLASNTALKDLQGELSLLYSSIEKSLLEILAHLEASIDFIEQDIEPAEYELLLSKAKIVSSQVEVLLESYDVGKNLRGDWKILLVGETNVGKSSLFNRFFNEERAIVTNVPGTTRDLLQDIQFVGQHSVRFVDSAGFRDSDNEIEKIGIQKAKEQFALASIILWVIDGQETIPWSLYDQLPSQKVCIVVNKIDLLTEEKLTSLQKEIVSRTGKKPFSISALDGEGLLDLRKGIAEVLETLNGGDYKAIVTQPRQYHHLSAILEQFNKAVALMIQQESPELISQELQVALMEFNKLLGKTYDDQILDTIFSEFCLGK